MKQNFDNGSLIPKASLVTSVTERDDNSVNFLASNKKRLIKIFAIIVGILTISIFGVIAYKSLKYSKLPESIESVPLVKAELAPIKVIPKDPGGEHISNQDKLIYSTLENKNVKTKKLSEQSEVKELKEVYSDAKTIRAPANEIKPKAKLEVSKSNKPKVEKLNEGKSTTKDKTKEVKEVKKNESKAPLEKDNPKIIEAKVDVLALEKEVDSKPAVHGNSEAKQNSNTSIEKNSKSEIKAKISNPFDLVGENE